MAGPMAYLAPGKRSKTACAMTCALEWRNTSRPSSVSGLTMATLASRVMAKFRSTILPSSSIAIASLASRGLMDSATWNPVVPTSYSRVEESGRVTVIFAIVNTRLPGQRPHFSLLLTRFGGFASSRTRPSTTIMLLNGYGIETCLIFRGD